MSKKYSQTIDGFETTFQVNYLGKIFRISALCL